MGAYVSVEQCESQYNVIFNCTFKPKENVVGNIRPGQFQTDPDIAGTGVSTAFRLQHQI